MKDEREKVKWELSWKEVPKIPWRMYVIIEERMLYLVGSPRANMHILNHSKRYISPYLWPKRWMPND